VKTRLQVQTKDSAFSTNYSSMTDALVKIVHREGWKGLYAGLPSGLLGVASTNFAYFYWYSFIRSSYQRYLQRIAKRSGVVEGATLAAAIEIGTAMELLLGALAGAMAQMCTIPVSVVTTRQQTQLGDTETDQQPLDDQPLQAEGLSFPDRLVDDGLKPKSKQQASATTIKSSLAGKQRRLGIQEVLFQILREDGWQGLWRGLKPALVLTINPAITYGVFERLKTVLLRSKPATAKRLSSMEIFMLGLICKTLATIITYPYIMAKVRLQWKAIDYEINEKVRYKSAVDVLRRVWQLDGFPGIYKVCWCSLSILNVI
jgi:hypothetical protein